MVSQNFVDNLYGDMKKQLGTLLAEEPTIYPMGSSEDQWKGLGSDLKNKLTPFSKDTYQAQEFIFARLILNDENISFMDFITPVVNRKGRSVPGVGTFVSYVENPIPETFVERGFLSHQLYPHSLVVEEGIKPKKVLKQGMITSSVALAINSDKKLCSKLYGNEYCTVFEGGLSNRKYEVKVDRSKDPAGMFTIIPYKGHTMMIAKDAGRSGSYVDKPKYPWQDRLAALSGVANYINYYPEEGEEVGVFYMDMSLNLVVPPLLQYLDQTQGWD